MSKNIKIVFTGDLLLADREHSMGVGIGTKIALKQKLWRNNLKEIFLNADLSVMNLEGPIIGTNIIRTLSPWEGNPGIVDLLRSSKINVLNLANNHILEHGAKGYRDTISIIEESGINIIGSTQNSGIYRLDNDGGVSVAMAGLNAIHDIPNCNCYVELNEENISGVLSNEDMKSADVKVLVFHWGDEYVHIPSWEQVQIARKAIDMGAHIVVGHHPHVIQPIEKYKDGIICYSLGNFVFDMLWSQDVRIGMILEVCLNKNGIESWSHKFVKYDTTYTTGLYNSTRMSRRFQYWTTQFRKLYLKGEDHYRRVYQHQAKKGKIIARILMKVQLFLQWRKLSWDTRKNIIQGIIKSGKAKIDL
jgi:gamma-polyglutamate biosynthesis protein CapA